MVRYLKSKEQIEGDTMTNKEIAEVLVEVYEAYKSNLAKWIKQTGSEDGFNEWFTDQVKRTRVL